MLRDVPATMGRVTPYDAGLWACCSISAQLPFTHEPVPATRHALCVHCPPLFCGFTRHRPADGFLKTRVSKWNDAFVEHTWSNKGMFAVWRMIGKRVFVFPVLDLAPSSHFGGSESGTCDANDW